ncbi:DNA glycosylase AlkZ-like family protein [Acidisoma sp. 7E03]
MTLSRLRLQAAAGLAAGSGLGDTLSALGFVQADPIRAPARAQDLILRHRVTGYRVGQLERRFPRLGLEEDFLYAYGFMPQDTARLLHPRPDPDRPDTPHRPEGLAAEILALVRAQGAVHPRDLEAAFGRDRAVNAWGGFSKETTQHLQTLHYHGHLRVRRRQEGIRIYEAAGELPTPLAPEARRERLLTLLLSLFEPISRVALGGVLNLLRRGAPGLGAFGPTLDRMIAAGAVEWEEIEGERYLWRAGGAMPDAPPRGLRFLAPFDPVVWDRRRFLHLWGWEYRFEAYTPAPQRRFGYYAMPMLWRDRMIGWVNLSLAMGAVSAEPGFVGAEPRGQDFARAYEAEMARFATFMELGRGDAAAAVADGAADPL